MMCGVGFRLTDGEKSCAEELKKFLQDKIVKESIDDIRTNFETEKSLGSILIADFLFTGDEEARNRIIVDSFMRVNRFLELLD